jgi:hypothetical protein
MKIAIVTAAVSALVLGALAATGRADVTSASEQAAAPPTALAALAGEAWMKLLRGDATGAIADLQKAALNPDFPSAPQAFRARVYVLFFQAESKAHGDAAAYRGFIELGERNPALRTQTDYLFFEMRAAQAVHEDVDAADSLAALVKADPAVLPRLGEDGDFTVRDIVDRTYRLKDGGRTTLRLLEALHDTGYHANNVFWPNEPMWFHLFEAYVATDQQTKARALVASFTDPNSLIGLQADNRYAAYAADGPGKGDFKAAADTYLKALEDLAAANPRKLEGQVVVADYLVTLNRPADALRILDAAEASIRAAAKGHAPYDDLDAQLDWAMDARTRALEILTTVSDAEALKAATASQEKADRTAKAKKIDPVSQKINLADTYLAEGQNPKAISTLADIDLSRASPYGVMAAEEARACAYSGLGDQAHAKVALDYMKAHVDDSPRLLRSALRCAGDLDGLAGLLIASLDNPVTRNATLVELQHYLPALHVTAFEKREAAKEVQVRGRPDVQAAIARYGRVNTYPIYPTPE